MAHGVTLVSVLKSTSLEHRTEAGYWLGFAILGGLVPIWGQILLLPLFSQSFHFVDLVRHGEFVLYAAALLAPSLYLVVKDVTDTKFVRRPIFVLVALIGLFASALLYAGVITFSNLSRQGASLGGAVNEDFLVVVSLILFPASVAYAFIVVVLDNQRRDPNIAAEVRKKRERLEKEFDELEGNDG